ncbi:MAG: VTT domain-containing protein [Bacteroidota bacterium]|nr:VTT domain-containing protein [Ferruginibacter sp.]
MQETILQLFNDHPNLAVGLSLAVSVVVAILGLVPSVFITAANILFFGFWPGTLISFAGEAIGALVAFWLYRTGFKKTTQRGLQKYPSLNRLVSAEYLEAFGLIFSLRLIPFVPSGLITFAAAIGKVSWIVFLIASSLGKIPALLIEAYSVSKITEFNWQGKLILALVALGMLYYLIKRKKSG